MRVKEFVMRLMACLGLGKAKTERMAYKTAEIEKQKAEATEFRDEIRRQTQAMITQLRAQTRLRSGGSGDDAHPRSSY